MLRILFTLLVLNVLFLTFSWLSGSASGLPLLAAEALLLTGLFLLLPAPGWRTLPAFGVALLYVVAALFIGFDRLVQTSLGRPLNVYLDFPLLRSAYELSLTNLGALYTALIALGGLLMVIALIVVLGQLLIRLPGPGRHTRMAGLMLLIAGLGASGTATLGSNRVTAEGIGTLATQWQQAIDTRQTQQAFAASLRTRAEQARPQPLKDLADRDVYLIFIESYGMAALSNPEYASAMQDHLALVETQLSSGGLHAQSGKIEAPVQGGQSWLSHGTLLSGEWIPDQLRYETFLDSAVPSLIDDFNHTGHDTHAVMPANTRDWPPGRQYGFDEVHDATNMGYAGPTMNFFTMPDQYTLSWLNHELRARTDGPLFATIALISSHAPWVPVLPVLNWEEIGDGSLFNEHAEGHPTPEEVFQDNAQLRDYYLRSVQYSLQVVADFATRYLPEDALLIAVGDHEAPPIVTDSDVSRAVPFHLVSSDRDLLADWTRTDHPFAGTMVSGLWPDPEEAVGAPGMNQFRQALHSTYGSQEDQPNPPMQ